MAYAGDLTVADSYSRLQHGIHQQRVREARANAAAALGLPVDESKLNQDKLSVPPWFELPNAAVHGNKNNVTAYPEQLWPTQSTKTIWRENQDETSPIRRSKSAGGLKPEIGTREWGQRPWVMPMASFVKPSNRQSFHSTLPKNHMSILPASATTRGVSSREFDMLPKDSINPGYTGRLNDSNTSLNSYESNKDLHSWDTRIEGGNKPGTKAGHINTTQAQDYSSQNSVNIEGVGALSPSSNGGSPGSPTLPVQFERAPRRPHFYALLDLSLEAHRKRLHSVWPKIKAEFRRYPAHGLRVDNELIPMLLRCGTSLGKEQFMSLIRQLPSHLQVKGARITYFVFLEFFGLLEKDGTVVEPLMTEEAVSEKEDLRITSEGQWEEIQISDLPAPDNSMFPLKPEIPNEEIQLPTEKTQLVTEPDSASAGTDVVSATRFSTRLAMEWNSFKDENMSDEKHASLAGESHSSDENDEESKLHAVDISLNEVRFMSASSIQAAARGHITRRKNRLRRALALCQKHDDAILRRIVREWGEYTQRIQMLRDGCRRPFHRLRRYMRGLSRHRFMMTHCFWSFYVWRRYSAGRVFVRHKVRNLLEIMNTVLKIRYFRAWTRYHHMRKQKYKLAVLRRQHMDKWRCRQVVLSWHPWARHRSQLLKNWREKGAHLASRNAFSRRITWFAVWRYYTYLRLVIRERSHMYWLFENKVPGLRSSEVPGQNHGVANHHHDGDYDGGGVVDDDDNVISNEENSLFSSDPLWMRQLEPLLSINSVCLGSILSSNSEADEDEDDEEYETSHTSGRVLPQSVRAHIINVSKPMLQLYSRKDRNERAISYCILKRVGPAIFQAFRYNVLRKRKKRYCVGRGLHLRIKHSFRKFKQNCDHCRRKRLRRGEPLPAVWIKLKREREVELLKGLSLKEQEKIKAQWRENGGPPGFTSSSPKHRAGRKSVQSKNQERTGDEGKSTTGNDIEEKESYKGPQIELTLEARNRRREARIKEIKEEFEADDVRRRNGFRINEKLQMEVKDLRERILVESADKSLQHAISMEAISAEEAIMSRVVVDVKNDTEKRRDYVLEHMESVKRRRARILHDVLFKVIDECNAAYTRELAIQCLRRLRIHAVSRNSESIFVKARIRNWLAICARLRRLDKGMPRYYEMKLKYKSLYKWIWLLRKRYQYATKGLVRKIDRRKCLYARFSEFLDKRLAIDGKSMSQDALYMQLNQELKPCFLRWVEFTQLSISHRTIIHLCSKRRRLRILRRALTGIMMSIRSSYTLKIRRSAIKFSQRRIDMDLEAWRRRMLAGTHRLTALWTRRKNEYVRRKMIQHAIKGDSFKKLDRDWTETANMRIRLEQRLLFLEFQKRGQCPCEDVYLPQLSDVHENEGGDGSVLVSEKSKGLNADHENMYTDGPLAEGSVLRSVTVYVDGWIVGIETAVTWRIIIEAGVGLQETDQQESIGEPIGAKGGKLKYKVQRRTTLHGKKAKNAFTFNLDQDDEDLEAKKKDAVEGNKMNQKMPEKKKRRKKKTKMKKEKKDKKNVDGRVGDQGGRPKAKDQIVAIEGFAADVVGRVRFICGSGRTSPWYGQIAVGEHFIFMGDSRRTPDPCEVVGFHGLADHDGLKSINPIMRYTLDAPIFSNCWTEHAARQALAEEAKRQRLLSNNALVEEVEDDRGVGFEETNLETSAQLESIRNKKKKFGAPSGDESQFAAVLRMRSVDIREALSRAQKLVRRIRRSPNIPLKLQPLKIAMAIGRWYFESLCHGLVKLKGSDVDEGERLVEQGEGIVRRGQNMVNHGKHVLSKIAEYRADGNHALRPAVTGRAYAAKIQGDIASGEAVVKQGRMIREQGRELLERGFELMPHIPRNKSLKRYFESLVELAKVRDMLGPEAFEVAPGTPRMGSDDDEQEHLSSLGDTAEARAGILAAKSGEVLARGGIGV